MYTDISEDFTIFADRGYAANHLLDWLMEEHIIASIPSCSKNLKIQFEYGIELYKFRNIMKRMFNCLID